MDEPNKLVQNGGNGTEQAVRDGSGRFVEGHPPTSPGRPKGKTIKEMVREWLEDHPEDMEGFVKHFAKENRALAWQMLEGRPQQDVTSDGKALPQPIYAIPGNNSPQEDQPPQAPN